MGKDQTMTSQWIGKKLKKKRKEKSKWKIQGIVGSKQSQPKKTNDRSAQPSITISTCIIIVATPFSFFLPPKTVQLFLFYNFTVSKFKSKLTKP